jgi:intracellular multiplication protein IcmL
MIGHRSELARFQSDFYRDNYRKLLVALILSIIALVCLIGAIIYVVLTQPKPEYYASTLSGKVIRMTPRT